MSPAVVVAIVACLVAVGLIIYLRVTRRRPASISDSAGELAEAHSAGARKRRDANYAAGVTAGEESVAEADAAAEEEVANAGSLADHLRDLGSD